jgi:hypothetical protein
MPRDVLVICLGKSTYARCGIIVNVTPLEPEWEGHVTLEFSNTTPLPAKIYANEGACQFLFLKGATPCEVSYKDRQAGKYHGPARRHAAAALSGGKFHGQHSHQGRPPAQGRDQHQRRQERGAAADGTCLLTDQTSRLDNVPDLADITTMTNLLRPARRRGHDPSAAQRTAVRRWSSRPRITETTAPYDLVRKMRASVLVLGPLVARQGQAKVSLPGGCAIGTRPVDLHIKGLQQRWAPRSSSTAATSSPAPGGLKGGDVTFPKVSVGATENLLMAATLAKGRRISSTPRASRRSPTSPIASTPWARKSTGSARTI